MTPRPGSECAGSQVIGTVMVMMIAIIMAFLFLLFCLGFGLPQAEGHAPVVFKITNVIHASNGKMIRESKVVLTNIGKQSYPNRNLVVKLSVNGTPVNLYLPTLNGDASCSVQHFGVQNIGGQGTYGGMNNPLAQWYPDQMVFIDFSNGTFGPGDTICIEIYDGLTGAIISRDTYPEQKKYDTKWFYNYFLSPQAA